MMSIKISRAVWQHFHEGGNLKVVLLALADWADDKGGRLYPSIQAIADKVCCGTRQAQRTVHELIERRFVIVVGNQDGGAPGSSRRYQINLERLTGDMYDTPTLTETGVASVTPHTSATGVMGDARRVTFTAETGVVGDTLTVIEQPLCRREVRKANGESATKRRRKHLPLTPCPDDIEVTDHMSQWAISKGVPEDRVMDETEKFLNHYIGKGTLNYDWVATWRNWMLKAVEFAQPGQSVRQQSAMRAV